MKNLLLQEIEKLRKGEFSDDLIQSIVNNEKKNIMDSLLTFTNSSYITIVTVLHIFWEIISRWG